MFVAMPTREIQSIVKTAHSAIPQTGTTRSMNQLRAGVQDDSNNTGATCKQPPHMKSQTTYACISDMMWDSQGELQHAVKYEEIPS